MLIIIIIIDVKLFYLHIVYYTYLIMHSTHGRKDVKSQVEFVMNQIQSFFVRKTTRTQGVTSDVDSKYVW